MELFIKENNQRNGKKQSEKERKTYPENFNKKNCRQTPNILDKLTISSRLLSKETKKDKNDIIFTPK